MRLWASLFVLVACSSEAETFEPAAFETSGAGATGATHAGGASSSEAASSATAAASGQGGGATSTAGAGGAGGGGGAGGAVQPASCADQYGASLVCIEDATQCEVLLVLNGGSCDDACTAKGGECLAAHSDDNDTCNYNGTDSCDKNVDNDELCTCSHGCGGMPACTMGKICKAGVCS